MLSRRWLAAVVAAIVPVAFGQRNVTILDTDDRITFNPLCTPRTNYCSGGWYSFSFTQSETRTVTFGPSSAMRNILPNASLQFIGTAVYYYGVTSAKTASVSITLDNGTPELVNLTASMNLPLDEPIHYPVLAWYKTGLDPVEHTFYLEWSETDTANGKWAGFDNVVYTQPSTVTSSVSDTTRTGATVSSTDPVNSDGASNDGTSSKKSNGGLIGGVVAGVVALIALILLAIFLWKRRQSRKSNHDFAIDDDPRGLNPPTGSHPTSPPMTSVTPYSILPMDDSNNNNNARRTSQWGGSQSDLTSSNSPSLGAGTGFNVSNPGANPDQQTMQQILNQQRAIMDMLAQQQAGGSSSSSAAVGTAIPQASVLPAGWAPDRKHVYEPPVPRANAGLPPGAAAPRVDAEAAPPPAYNG